MLFKNLICYQNDFILKFFFSVKRAIANLTDKVRIRIQQSFSWIILFGCILIVLLLFFFGGRGRVYEIYFQIISFVQGFLFLHFPYEV